MGRGMLAAMTMKGAALAVAATLVLSSACNRSVTIVLGRDAGLTTTITIAGAHARIDHPDRGEGSPTATIFDAATGNIFQLDGRRRTSIGSPGPSHYTPGGTVSGVRYRRTGRQFHYTPHEQRWLRDVLDHPSERPRAPSERDAGQFEPMPEGKTIAGISCRMYRRIVAGKPREEVCVAPWGAAGVQKSELAPFRGLVAARIDDFGFPGGPYQNPLAELESYPGMPVWRTTIYLDGSRGREERLISITRGSVPSSLFSVPPGYTPDPDYSLPPP
jgi:hypothetical protein